MIVEKDELKSKMISYINQRIREGIITPDHIRVLNNSIEVLQGNSFIQEEDANQLKIKIQSLTGKNKRELIKSLKTIKTEVVNI